MIITEPMKLSLGYTYNLNVMEQILAKDSLLTLDESIRRCQKNPQDVCTNKKFLDALQTNCQCLPFQLKFLVEKVCIQNKKILDRIHTI